MGKPKDDYALVRQQVQRAAILIAGGLPESKAAREVGLPRSSLQRYLANGLPDGPVWPEGAHCPDTPEERKRFLETLQPAESQPDQRDSRGRFLPGNTISEDRPARIAKAKLEKFCPQVADKLIKVFKNLPSSEPELVLAYGREILDRGLGKPKQTLDVKEAHTYEEYRFVEQIITSADEGALQLATTLAKRMESHTRDLRRASEPGSVEIIPPPRETLNSSGPGSIR
ncbi:Uncharacterised protein [uncultured archaeon]|nr:Uncharacterised protein [uncultured archaeon]